jgi:hypothetical protein
MALDGVSGPRPKRPDLPIHRRHGFIVGGLSEDDALAEVKSQIDRLRSS